MRAARSGVAVLVGAMVVSGIFTLFNGVDDRQDFLPSLYWTLPLCVLCAWLLPRMSERWSGQPLVARVAGLVLVGLGVALLWTLFAFGVAGEHLATLGVPLPACWLVGIVGGAAVSGWRPGPRPGHVRVGHG